MEYGEPSIKLVEVRSATFDATDFDSALAIKVGAVTDDLRGNTATPRFGGAVPPAQAPS